MGSTPYPQGTGNLESGAWGQQKLALLYLVELNFTYRVKAMDILPITSVIMFLANPAQLFQTNRQETQGVQLGHHIRTHKMVVLVIYCHVTNYPES